MTVAGLLENIIRTRSSQTLRLTKFASFGKNRV